MKLIKIIFFISFITLTSCYSTKRLIRENDFQVSDFNENTINGIYNDSIALWRILRSNYTFKEDSILPTKKYVELTLSDQENLNVKLIDSSKMNVIDEINLKGKIKDNFFSIDRNLNLIPLPPIYYINKENKTLLANDDDGNLVLVCGVVGEGMILFMAAGSKRIINYKFNRIKK